MSLYTDLNAGLTSRFVHDTWQSSIIPTLSSYIGVENCTPMFSDFHNPNETEKAVAILESWARAQPIQGLSVEVVRLPGLTPLIFIEVESSLDVSETILMYGHCDKQPPLRDRWRDGLHPYKAVIEGDRLYGRGGADDGYSICAALTAISVLQQQNVPHARCVIIIEGSEESGSPDLPAYVDHLSDRIGTPDLVICLDSGCGDYERLWLTTSLRGVIAGDLRASVLEEEVHSGHGSGMAASSYDIVSDLLGRLRKDSRGQILQDALFAPRIPADRIQQVKLVAKTLGDQVYQDIRFIEGVCPLNADPFELLMNNTWHPFMTITGQDGLPSLGSAGNVLLPSYAVKISMRIPPLVDPVMAAERMRQVLEMSPPFGAQVSFIVEKTSAGWNAPTMEYKLEQAVNNASQAFFGKDVMLWGEGGSIPFMEMLAKKFPKAQFIVIGLLGPESNAHGPNEFLHILTGEKLTACVASIVGDMSVVWWERFLFSRIHNNEPTQQC